MHCEHNFAKNIFKIVIGKKNSVKMRRNLQCRGIRPHLWLTINLQKGGKMLKPTTPHVLIVIEFDFFSTTIENLETPLGHFSVMGKHIKKKNFGNLKSHDYHILMQQILRLALRGCLALSPTSNECKKNFFCKFQHF
jgi:hypothetical protein